jgi:hypothetical protein
VQARGDLAHAVRVDADAGLLHPAEDARERKLDVAVEGLGAALAHAVEQRLAQAQRHGRMPHEARSLLLGLRLGDGLDRVLRSEVVEEVLAPRRLDQVGQDHRVVGRLDAQRLRIVRDERPFEPLRTRRDDDLVGQRDGDASVVRGDPRDRVDARHVALMPGNCRAGRDPLAGRHRLVELVDPPEERAELELPERLAQLRTVGRSEHELGRIAVELEIALHGREHLRRPRLLPELRQVLLARRRQLLDVLEHPLE